MTIEAGPDIVQDSLTMCFDAYNIRSYPGSGTIWYDLGSYAQNLSITNTTFSSGTAVVDGTSVCETSVNTSFGTNTTWEAWIKCTQSLNTYNMFLGRHLPYFCFYSGNRLMFSNIINSVQQSLYGDANLSLNTWYQAVATTQYDGVNTITKLYVNGVQSGSTGTFSGIQSNPTYRFSIGDGHSKVQFPAQSPWYPFKGNVGIVRIYDKTLTQVEITKNFNATRGRYGI